MSLTLDLLNKSTCASSYMLDSTNFEEIYNQLEQPVLEDNNINSNFLTNLFVKKLEKLVASGQVMDDNNKIISDIADLNILIEKSLLEFQMDNKHESFNILNIDSLREIKEKIKGNDEDKDLKIKLLNHYIMISQLGYIQDISADENMPRTNSNIERSLEDLVSTVVSLSIQKNISLPKPKINLMESLEGRLSWCQECIISLTESESIENGITNRNINGNLKSESIIPSLNDKEIGGSLEDLKTALNDLQFAHTYLTRQYHDERNQHHRSLNELRLKFSKNQDLLKQSNNQLTKLANQLLNKEMNISDYKVKLASRDKELHDLQMTNNLLKVDYLGLVPIGNLMSPPHTRNSTGAGSDSHSSFGSISSVNSTATNTNATSSSNVSVSILRVEFKKLVEQMNNRFTKKLEEEKAENERLQALVRSYETKDEK